MSAQPACQCGHLKAWHWNAVLECQRDGCTCQLYKKKEAQ